MVGVAGVRQGQRRLGDSSYSLEGSGKVEICLLFGDMSETFVGF